MSTSRSSLSARVGGLSRHAQHGSAELSRQGSAALYARFEREVDPDGTLTVTERRSRADAARRAHMTRLALASAKSRSRMKGGRSLVP